MLLPQINKLVFHVGGPRHFPVHQRHRFCLQPSARVLLLAVDPVHVTLHAVRARLLSEHPTHYMISSRKY